MTQKRVPALTASEESAWRALTYVANHLVPTLGDDLARTTSMSLSEYLVLVHLSEAERDQLRIGDLAHSSALSSSRMSRLVDDMETKGLVAKSRSDNDGRCTWATLTPLGRRTLEATYPTQLANVRRRVFDVLTEEDVTALAVALTKIRHHLDSSHRASTREMVSTA